MFKKSSLNRRTFWQTDRTDFLSHWHSHPYLLDTIQNRHKGVRGLFLFKGKNSTNKPSYICKCPSYHFMRQEVNSRIFPNSNSLSPYHPANSQLFSHHVGCQIKSVFKYYRVLLYDKSRNFFFQNILLLILANLDQIAKDLLKTRDMKMIIILQRRLWVCIRNRH